MQRTTHEQGLITIANPRSAISEAYKELRTNIQHAASDRKIQVILVSSAEPGEGKTTTLANLAVVYALEDHHVLIMDADFRRPKLHRLFYQSNHKGLSNILQGEVEAADVLQDTHIAKCTLLASGPAPQHPGELLASQQMAQIMKQLRANYDVILIDSPALLAVADAQVLTKHCDGVLMVLQAGKVKRDAVKEAVSKLKNVKAYFIGAVLNNIDHKNKSSVYRYYYENG